MTTEVQFAKSFLAALDGRPTKLPADYVEDPRGYPARSPYVLPRMPRPMRKTAASKPAPGQERSVAVTVKSLHRSPHPLDVNLGSLPLATTSLLDVRTAVADQSGVPLAKLKLLHSKKPVADSKVLQDLVGNDENARSLELTVMVMGGAATVAAAAEAAKPSSSSSPAAASPATTQAKPDDAAAAAASGSAAVESEAFWNDLRGFLVQRIRDDKKADEVFSLFLRAWQDRME